LVHRATNYKNKPAKPYAINEVVLATFREGYIHLIESIGSRLNDKENWAVVLKALILTHNCFEGGSPEFESEISTRSFIFTLNKYSLTTNENPNNPLTVFIKKYSRYLEEKCNVIRNFQKQFEKNTKELSKASISECLKFLPKLQSQFNALCNCKITNVQKASLIILRAYFLLLRDSISLYTLLNGVVMRIYNSVDELKKKKEKIQFIEKFLNCLRKKQMQ
jgi:hypothetical protein